MGLKDCQVDGDCVVVDQIDCCPCQMGGQQAAINHSKEGELSQQVEVCCAAAGVCVDVNMCLDNLGRDCNSGTCTLVHVAATPTPTPTATAVIIGVGDFCEPDRICPPPLLCLIDPPHQALVCSCVGDCDGNAQVTVDELLAVMNEALGTTVDSACSIGDANSDGEITVDEIVLAVDNGLYGCQATPTVLSFVGFDSNGITQNDQVSPTSAVVCLNGVSNPITRTTINATFLNEEAADIHLNRYAVHFNDPRSGLPDVISVIASSPNIRGGRCSNSLTMCAVDADCLPSGGTDASPTATCDHKDTTVPGIVLIDLPTKARVNPQVIGQPTSLTVTFSGVDDADRPFQVTTGYTVVFSDSPDCGSARSVARRRSRWRWR